MLKKWFCANKTVIACIQVKQTVPAPEGIEISPHLFAGEFHPKSLLTRTIWQKEDLSPKAFFGYFLWLWTESNSGFQRGEAPFGRRCLFYLRRIIDEMNGISVGGETFQRAPPSGLLVTFFAGAKKVTKESTCIKVALLDLTRFGMVTVEK